jgi:hypothetical protein
MNLAKQPNGDLPLRFGLEVDEGVSAELLGMLEGPTKMTNSPCETDSSISFRTSTRLKCLEITKS